MSGLLEVWSDDELIDEAIHVLARRSTQWRLVDRSRSAVRRDLVNGVRVRLATASGDEVALYVVTREARRFVFAPSRLGLSQSTVHAPRGCASVGA